jgi:phospholipase C
LIVIAPYARAHYVSHVQHEFGSMLKFTEETFALAALGTTDVRADDLADCFNFSQPPIRFRPIKKNFSAKYFIDEPVSTQAPDDE